MYSSSKIETNVQFKWIELVSSSTLILVISTNVSQALVSEHMQFAYNKWVIVLNVVITLFFLVPVNIYLILRLEHTRGKAVQDPPRYIHWIAFKLLCT